MIIVATMAMITISTTIDTILFVLLLLKFILLPSLILFPLPIINLYVNSNVFPYILYSLQYFCKKQSSHFGLLALQIVRPNVII